MNQKLVDEFSKKLKALDENLTCEVLENETTENKAILIKYKSGIVFALVDGDGVPSIIIDNPRLVNKDEAFVFGNLLKLCGEYLDAFFGGDEHDN